MANMKSSFGASFASGTCDPDKWKSYFLQYDSDVWELEGHSGGPLYYESDDNKRFVLGIIHWVSFGFLLQWDCTDLTTKRSGSAKYSVSDASRLDEFAELDEMYFPVGCFLAPEVAWLAVEDFLRQPPGPSSRIQWVDGNDIPWPEM